MDIKKLDSYYKKVKEYIKIIEEDDWSERIKDNCYELIQTRINELIDEYDEAQTWFEEEYIIRVFTKIKNRMIDYFVDCDQKCHDEKMTELYREVYNIINMHRATR